MSFLLTQMPRMLLLVCSTNLIHSPLKIEQWLYCVVLVSPLLWYLVFGTGHHLRCIVLNLQPAVFITEKITFRDTHVPYAGQLYPYESFPLRSLFPQFATPHDVSRLWRSEAAKNSVPPEFVWLPLLHYTPRVCVFICVGLSSVLSEKWSIDFLACTASLSCVSVRA